MKTLQLAIIGISVLALSFSISHEQTSQDFQYPHGIGSNSSALYNSIGLTYEQCQNKLSQELEKTADSLDRGKAVALALSSPDFQTKVAGHKYVLGIVSTNDTWDNSLCGNVKRTAVGVGFNFLDTPDTYIESIGVAEDANLSKVTEVGTTMTPVCHNNCPLAIPTNWQQFSPDISSDIFFSGRIIPNATIPVGFDIVNEGNFTLHDVQVGFVDSPLLLNFKTNFGNFTLEPGHQKTIEGTILSPSEISNVQSNLNWMVYANNQGGETGSKEFSRIINLANMSTPEGSMTYPEILHPLKQNEPVNGILCKKGFQLIINSERYTPACVTQDTNQKLIERGWGISLESLLAPPSVKKMEIVGLQQNYKVGQPITATIKYTGYLNGGIEPDVKILDANDTQVWDSCCFAHTESIGLNFGTFTYIVQGPTIVNGLENAGYPMINKTGTFTMVASLDGKTTQSKFIVTASPTSLNQTSNPTVSNGPESKIGPDLLGPIPHRLVFFMKSNSTAKIYVEYKSNLQNTGTVQSFSSVYVGKTEFTPLNSSDVTITAKPSSIPLTLGSDTKVVYHITAKEGTHGVYWISLVQFCGVIPLAIDVNSLTLSPFDIPVHMGSMYCPAQFLEAKILGISDGTAEYKISQPVR